MERFWKYVDKTVDCWEWTGSLNNRGYGQFRIEGTTRPAHRVSWELTHGTIPAHDSYHGYCVCHKCDNPRCVRPGHLFLGTHRNNMDDKARKCRAGNLDPLRINKLHYCWLHDIGTPGDLCRKFGISKTYLLRLVSGLSRGIPITR